MSDCKSKRALRFTNSQRLSRSRDTRLPCALSQPISRSSVFRLALIACVGSNRGTELISRHKHCRSETEVGENLIRDNRDTTTPACLLATFHPTIIIEENTEENHKSRRRTGYVTCRRVAALATALTALALSECDSAPDARLTKGVPVPMQSVSEVAYRPTFV